MGSEKRTATWRMSLTVPCGEKTSTVVDRAARETQSITIPTTTPGALRLVLCPLLNPITLVFLSSRQPRNDAGDEPPTAIPKNSTISADTVHALVEEKTGRYRSV
jgi:hypothetical protein